MEKLTIRQNYNEGDELDEYKIVRIVQYSQLYNEEVLEVWGTQDRAKERKKELEEYFNIKD